MTGSLTRSVHIGRGHHRALAFAAGVGLLVDQWLGEPPVRLHPVVWFGRAMGAVEQRLHADRRHRGLMYTGCGTALGVTSGLGLARLMGRRLAAVAATALAVGGHMLDGEATGIANRLEQGDLVGARVALRSLVGRRTDELSEPEVVRAVIESVAENTVDAVTAALCFAAAGGAPAVGAYRAINTMDAMVGHRNDRYRRFGWASARVDDIANFVPARLTAALLLAPLLLRPQQDQDPDSMMVLSRRARVAMVRSQAARHPSPNGGLVEAAFALRLGVVLGGVNHYGDSTEDRGRLGHGRAPTRADIQRAVALRRQVSILTAALLALLAMLSTLAASAARRIIRPPR